jgi:hypothetical protein
MYSTEIQSAPRNELEEMPSIKYGVTVTRKVNSWFIAGTPCKLFKNAICFL